MENKTEEPSDLAGFIIGIIWIGLVIYQIVHALSL